MGIESQTEGPPLAIYLEHKDQSGQRCPTNTVPLSQSLSEEFQRPIYSCGSCGKRFTQDEQPFSPQKSS